jgi:hypothetical protein
MIRPILIAIAMSALIGCSHHASVREEMTWKCDPERTAQNPRAQSVMFLFVKKPAIGSLHAAPGFCDQLKAAGKPVVAVEYDVWGNSADGVHGFRAVKIDGKPFEDSLRPSRASIHSGRIPSPRPLNRLTNEFRHTPKPDRAGVVSRNAVFRPQLAHRRECTLIR